MFRSQIVIMRNTAFDEITTLNRIMHTIKIDNT